MHFIKARQRKGSFDYGLFKVYWKCLNILNCDQFLKIGNNLTKCIENKIQWYIAKK